jgi:signal transduction histidine kinase
LGLSVLALILLLPIPTKAQTNFYQKPLPSMEINTEWQYRWGDSPINSSGQREWAINDPGNRSWNWFKVPEQPPNIHNFRNVWVRAKLPQGKWPDPGLLFATNDQRFQVFLDGKMIYQYGNMERSYRQSPGSPLHIIPLPLDFQNKIISFRMHSTFARTAGLLRMVQIGSRSELQLKIVRESIDYLILAGLFIFLGLVLIIIFALESCEQKSFLALGFSSICVGSWLVAETNMKQILFDIPVHWSTYIAIASFYLMPIGFCAFVEQIFGGRYNKMLQRLRQVYYLFTVVVFTLDITHVLTLAATLSYFYLLVLITIILLITVVVEAGIKGNPEAKIFGLGITIFAIAGIYDILGWYFRVVPWTRYFTHWGLFVFILSLTYLLKGRFTKVYEQLKDYSLQIESKNEVLNHIWIEVKKSRDEIAEWNKALEKRVIERNEQLETANEELNITLETLRRTQAQLVQSEKMVALGGLVAGVAHEINTPMGVSVTAASYLAQNTKEFWSRYQTNQMKRSDLEKYLNVSDETCKIILVNLDRATELIKSFKQVAVDQSSEIRRSFKVKKYIGEVLLSLKPKLKKTKLEIVVQCDDDLTIDSYPGALAQIITNLVMNSITHAYDENSEGRITFRISQNNQELTFSFSDDGKGITSANKAKIFDPFFTTKRANGGTGLGLHIVYNLVTQTLGGTIECESKPGQGTTFIIVFPI